MEAESPFSRGITERGKANGAGVQSIQKTSAFSAAPRENQSFSVIPERGMTAAMLSSYLLVGMYR
jgi:hypothetical protein